jgi:hypothetical protein
MLKRKAAGKTRRRSHLRDRLTDNGDTRAQGSLQLNLTGISLIPTTKFERILRIGPLGSAFG